MSAVSLSINSRLYTKLEEISAITGIEKHAITEKALEQYLQELLEDIEDAKIGEKAWEEFVATGQKGIPASDVYQDLDL